VRFATGWTRTPAASSSSWTSSVSANLPPIAWVGKLSPPLHADRAHHAEREAVVRFQVLGPAGQGMAVEAAIDTGFDGYLTLPAGLVRDLDLPFLGTTTATLGDGNSVHMALHLASVL
jgi:hypothetical protein